MNKYPVSKPRNIKAEITYYLGLAATALLFDSFLLLAFWLS